MSLLGSESTETACIAATQVPFDPAAADPLQTPDNLVALLLQEQQRLSAVEQFAQQHDNGNVSAASQRYSGLLPASRPNPGQQYAFEVDLDCCSGCKSCVTACHSLNGLDESETWRDVGLLLGGTTANPVMQHVTTACHHCVEPACMSACPVNAYEKDPSTGIVQHLDDQCFGCQYCTLACPYDVPKYHSQLGIVRKCDMCSDRLGVGEAPACAQACPTSAISIKVVDVEDVQENSEADYFLPAAPDPSVTLPTTNYKTSQVFPRNMLPADYYSLSPQHPHWPLIIMLVLTQLSVGAFVVSMVLESTLDGRMLPAFRSIQASSGLLFGVLALGASVLHLGRPQYAYRAVLGLKHSWLSREIVAFGIFAALAAVYSAASWFTDSSSTSWLHVLGWAVAGSGVLAVLCSAMIYVCTRREFWGFSLTATKFFLTAAVLGIAATWLTVLLLGVSGINVPVQALPARRLAQALLLTMFCKLVLEASLFRFLAQQRNSQLKRSARLMSGPLSNHTLARFSLGFLGGVAMPVFLIAHKTAIRDAGSELMLVIIVAMLFLACLIGELLERYMFFAAAAAPRMPGGLRP